MYFLSIPFIPLPPPISNHAVAEHREHLRQAEEPLPGEEPVNGELCDHQLYAIVIRQQRDSRQHRKFHNASHTL